MNTTALTAVYHDHHAYLVDLAFRMLGSISEAEDVVQDAFTRILDRDLEGIEDIRAWLVVVVGRMCLDNLRSARVRRERPDPLVDLTIPSATPDPSDRVTLDDAVSTALVVVLQRLTPPERTAFVLHDIFQMPFEVVASIVGRSPAACRQLASRARRRVRDEAGQSRFDVAATDQHLISERFIAACAGGDMHALMEILDPDVVGEVDLGPLARPQPIRRGNTNVATQILRRFGDATLVSELIDGHPGALAFRGRELVATMAFTTRDGVIVDIHSVADPARLAIVAARLTSNRYG